MDQPSAPLRGIEPPAYGTIAAPPRPPRPAAASEKHVPNNPFVSGVFYQAEPVQPPAEPYRDLTDDGTY